MYFANIYRWISHCWIIYWSSEFHFIYIYTRKSIPWCRLINEGKAKTMGCVENLLIEKIFLNGTRRCTLRKEELMLQLGVGVCLSVCLSRCVPVCLSVCLSGKMTEWDFAYFLNAFSSFHLLHQTSPGRIAPNHMALLKSVLPTCHVDNDNVSSAVWVPALDAVSIFLCDCIFYFFGRPAFAHFEPTRWNLQWHFF